MSTFYVLPTRQILGSSLARILAPLVPGLELDAAACADLLDEFLSERGMQHNSFIVWQDDLDGERDARAELVQDYGAAPGDRIVRADLSQNRDLQRISSKD